MPKTKIKPKSKKPSSQWEIVEDFKLIPMAQDGKKIKNPIYNLSHEDSVKHQADKILKYEQLRGSPTGSPLPYYGEPQYMDMLMKGVYPEVNKILPNASAMEKGEAMDFIFNAGWDKDNNKIIKDPRAYALQEYYKKYDSSKLKDGKWEGRKNAPYSFDEEYNTTIGKLPENERRILMNRGRDWYYKNINNPSPGVPNPAYENTWYGRIWNTNDFNEFNSNNPNFTPKKKSGGKIKTDPKGYWNKENIGKPVNIPSNKITMKGVNQPLMGISNTGDMQMMYPNGEYQFQGNSVTEFPITMQQGGVTPKDELIKIDGEWHNQDIIDGLERGYRVEQRRWNSNLNRYGTVNEEEFYKKFPTEEHFILENQRRYANHIGSSRKYVPQDETLMQQGGQVRQPIKGTKEQYQAYQDSAEVYNDYLRTVDDLSKHGYIASPRIKANIFGQSPEYLDSNYTTPMGTRGAEYYKKKFQEGDKRTYKQIDSNKFTIQDIDNEMVNTDLRPQLFNSKINPKGRQIWSAPDLYGVKAPNNFYFDSWYNEHYPFKQDIRSVFNYENAKPVQPIIYTPENERQNPLDQPQVPFPNTTNGQFNRTISEIRPKQTTIQIESKKADLLPTSPMNLEIERIPFAQGTYFTRDRQNQELDSKQFGRKGKKDYFDKKTGELLGTYKNGGKASDWEITG